MRQGREAGKGTPEGSHTVEVVLNSRLASDHTNSHPGCKRCKRPLLKGKDCLTGFLFFFKKASKQYPTSGCLPEPSLKTNNPERWQSTRVTASRESLCAGGGEERSARRNTQKHSPASKDPSPPTSFSRSVCCVSAAHLSGRSKGLESWMPAGLGAHR